VLFASDRAGVVLDCVVDGIDVVVDGVALDVVLVTLDCVVEVVVEGVVDCVALDVVLVVLDCCIDVVLEVLFEVSEGLIEKAYCGNTSSIANKMKIGNPSFISTDLSNLVNKELLYIVHEHC
jgi:hypothetical protein